MANAAPDEGGSATLRLGVARAEPHREAGLDGGPLFFVSAGYNLTNTTAVALDFGLGSLDPSPRGYEPPVRVLVAGGQFTAGPRYGRWHPYAIGGAALYRFTLDAGAVSHGASEGAANKFGVSAGGGITARMSRHVALDASVRYHRVGDFVAIVPFGGSFVTAGVGVMWSR